MAAFVTSDRRFAPRERVRLLVSCLAWVHVDGFGTDSYLPHKRTSCRFLSTREPLSFCRPGDNRGTCLLRDAKGVLYVVPVGFLGEPK